jgi:putative hydrolase of the HAD superfamily
MIRAIVFDLDDTLYPESDFVTSGYRAVARHVADAYGCSFKAAFTTMMTTYVTHSRRMVFPVLLKRHLNASVPLAELVEVYRQHRPRIRMFPGYSRLLQRFAREYRLGIITDGLPQVQERKVEALHLKNLMHKIIYTWEYGPEKEKPHSIAFCLMLESLQADPASALFVGDNPEKDCKGAHGAGMICAQIQSPIAQGSQSGIAGQEAPEYVISSLHQLPLLLGRMN